MAIEEFILINNSELQYSIAVIISDSRDGWHEVRVPHGYQPASPYLSLKSPDEACMNSLLP